MKQFLISLIVLMCANTLAYGQESLTFSKVIEAKGLDKARIYISLKDWMATTYVDCTEVIQVDDKEGGLIIGKASCKYSMGKTSHSSYDGIISYTIKFQIKDERFKAELSTFIHDNIDKPKAPTCKLGLVTNAEEFTNKGMYKSYHNAVWKDLQEKCESHSNDIFTVLESRVASAKESDNW